MESYAVRNAFIISFMQRSIEHQVAYKSMLGRHKLTSRIYSKIRLHHYGPSSLDLGSTWRYINTKLLYHAEMDVCVTGRERKDSRPSNSNSLLFSTAFCISSSYIVWLI